MSNDLSDGLIRLASSHSIRKVLPVGADVGASVARYDAYSMIRRRSAA